MFGVEPTSAAGRCALTIYAEALAAVRADVLINAALRRVGDILFVQDKAYELSHYDRIFVCGAGKAAGEMAASIAAILGDKLAGGLGVTWAESTADIPGILIMTGSHPVPDERSIAAGEAMLEFAASTNERDLVLFCLSGGASALMEALTPGIELPDLRSTTEMLLKAGANIHALNAVRTRLSRIKGGGLARAFRAEVVVLVISDVIGNDLSVVGSGPFLAPHSAGHHGHAIAFGFEDHLSPRIRKLLTADTKLVTPKVAHFVIGSAALLWPAAADAARRLGLEPIGYADPLKGEARRMADRIVRLARAKRARGEREFCMVFVGETTVKVRGDGKGGRCQEMATKAAAGIADEPEIAFLAAGTDGVDGPTDAAGGLVEPRTAAIARAAGASAQTALKQNDAYHFLEAGKALLKTGPTGTNVNDICLVVHAPG